MGGRSAAKAAWGASHAWCASVKAIGVEKARVQMPPRRPRARYRSAACGAAQRRLATMPLGSPAASPRLEQRGQRLHLMLRVETPIYFPSIVSDINTSELISF